MNVKLDFISSTENGEVAAMEEIVSSDHTISPGSRNSNGYDYTKPGVTQEPRPRTVTINDISINDVDHTITSPLVEHELSGVIPSSSEEESKLQGIVFLEDAFQYRSIHHKTTLFCLKLYRWYHSAPIKFSVAVATFLILILAFFETPSSISWSSDQRRLYTRYFFRTFTI